MIDNVFKTVIKIFSSPIFSNTAFLTIIVSCFDIWKKLRFFPIDGSLIFVNGKPFLNIYNYSTNTMSESVVKVKGLTINWNSKSSLNCDSILRNLKINNYEVNEEDTNMSWLVIPAYKYVNKGVMFTSLSINFTEGFDKAKIVLKDKASGKRKTIWFRKKYDTWIYKFHWYHKYKKNIVVRSMQNK